MFRSKTELGSALMHLSAVVWTMAYHVKDCKTSFYLKSSSAISKENKLNQIILISVYCVSWSQYTLWTVDKGMNSQQLHFLNIGISNKYPLNYWYNIRVSQLTIIHSGFTEKENRKKYKNAYQLSSTSDLPSDTIFI